MLTYVPLCPLTQTLSLCLRFVKTRLYGRALLPGGFVLFLQLSTLLGSIAIWRWFVAIGQPKRDAKGGVRVGDDLAGKGVIEMAWDLCVYQTTATNPSIYMTWICTLGSVLVSPKFWWLFLLVPAIGGFKLFGVAQPFLAMLLPSWFGPRPAASVPVQEGAAGAEPGESKKQAKLRARMEKGDKRVQQVQRR